MSGIGRVWMLTALVAAAGGGLAFLVWPLPTPISPFDATVPVFALLFYVAELTVVHFRFRRDAHSFSMSEFPLVLGLIMLSPAALIQAQLIGSGAALLINRRQAPVKLAFNLSQLTLQVGVAAATFHAVADLTDPLGIRGLVGVVLGVGCTLVVSNTLIGAAIRLSGGAIPRSDRIAMYVMSGGAGLMNTALGIVAAIIIWNRPDNAWIAIVPPMVLFFAYRAYMAQRQERERLQALYETSRELHRLPQLEAAMAAAVTRAREMFDVEVAEALIFPDGPDREGLRTLAESDCRTTVFEPAAPLEAGSLFVEVMSGGYPVVMTEDGEVLTERRKSAWGMAAPIPGPSGAFGVLTVSRPVGDIGGFAAVDIQLLETLAGHVGVSLENGRLEDSLAKLTELRDRLRHQALHDPLTGVANRAPLRDRLEHAAAGKGRKAAVLFLDLDDFKTINDSYGHDAGDEVLVAVAERLSAASRSQDLVARLGGDEFAMLLEDLRSSSDAAAAAERIIAGLQEPFSIGGRLVGVHASIGVAEVEPGADPDDVLRAADRAMYQAKRAGKGRFRVYGDLEPEDEVPTLSEELRAALGHAQLVLHYQPIVDVTTGEIVAVEALARWKHPVRGMISPTDFIPLAERDGFIREVGIWVMGEACSTLAEWHEVLGDRTPLMSVNLSASELTAPGSLRHVTRLIEEHGIDPSLVQLEITESAVVSRGQPILVELRSQGIKVALDDFGTGYSALAYLDQLPIDAIKIDRAFMERIADPKGALLVVTMLELAETLGFATIAEGIETEEQLATVTRFGCRYAQGYLLGSPLPAAEMLARLRHGSNPETKSA